MGAWGADPRDNDTALDFEGRLFGGLDDYDEIRYAAWLATQLRPDFPHLQEHAKTLINKLAVIQSDHGWLNRWKNGGEIRESLAAQVEALRGLIGQLTPHDIKKYVEGQTRQPDSSPLPREG